MRIELSRLNWRTLAAILLILTPLLLIGFKASHAPKSLALSISLDDLPKHARKHLDYLLSVPLSLVVVAFFRLTLGIRMLSIFRPVLIAIAFERIGIPLGLMFLAIALAAVVAIQWALNGRHYYERVPVVAVLIVGLMILSLLGFEHWHSIWMLRLAYFPVIALCLTCESFASALAKSGLAEAVWLAFTTTIAGIVVMEISVIPGFMRLFARYPELLLAEAGCVLLIGSHFNLRLIESLNPFFAAPASKRVPELQLSTEMLMEIST